MGHGFARNMLFILTIASVLCGVTAVSTWQDVRTGSLHDELAQSFTATFLTDETLDALRERTIDDGYSTESADTMTQTIKSQLGDCVADTLVSSIGTSELKTAAKNNLAVDPIIVRTTHDATIECVESISTQTLRK